MYTVLFFAVVSCSVHLWEPVHLSMIYRCLPRDRFGQESKGLLLNYWSMLQYTYILNSCLAHNASVLGVVARKFYPAQDKKIVSPVEKFKNFETMHISSACLPAY